ncbi:MAG: response regulator transcription factor [Cyclobacteriaceae bacterium]
MRKFTCIVVDDEELSRNLLENYIGRVSSLELVAKFKNPVEALANLAEHNVDIIFLDIQMPELTGPEFLRTISNPPAVIFTTAYNQYALEGFELSVTDYLLKPFSFTRFLKSVNRATELIELRRNAKSGSQADSLGYEANDEYLLINASRKLHRVYLKDIEYIQSDKEYVIYFTKQEKIMALGSLKRLEEELPSEHFIRVHKSYIIAKDRVRSIEGNQLNLYDTSIPIGGAYREMVIGNLF